MTRKRYRQRDGKIRLKGCKLECPCLCHDTGGGVRELHSRGFCDGKVETNSLSVLMQYMMERDSELNSRKGQVMATEQTICEHRGPWYERTPASGAFTEWRCEDCDVVLHRTDWVTD